MCQLPKPILLNYEHNYLLYTQISIVNRTFFKTQHTIICFRQISIVNHTFFKTLNTILSTVHTSSMPKPPCVQTEHTAIQLAKLLFPRLLCNLKSKLEQYDGHRLAPGLENN